MICTPKVFTNKNPRYPMTLTPIKKPSARKIFCLFTTLLDVKKKTAICQVAGAKSKHKAIKPGTTPW